jgi:hypothetical protein
MNRLIILIALALVTISCSASVRPIYLNKEQKTAEHAVERFHTLYSAEDYQSLLSLMDEAMRKAQSDGTLLAAMRQTFERWGKVRGSKLDQVKVFLGNPSEVRMTCNTEYEKGDGIEWFIWRVDDGGARLVQYQNFPAKDEPSKE